MSRENVNFCDVQEITVTIPVDPHVKQYLLNNEFISKPFKLSMSEPMGVMLMSLLVPKRQSGLPLRYGAGVETIEVSLGRKEKWRNRMYLPRHRARMFNKWLNEQIRQEFLLYVGTALQYNCKAKVDAVIRDFEEKYRFSDTTMRFATLKRMFYRTRKWQKSPLKNKLLPNLSLKS